MRYAKLNEQTIKSKRECEQNRLSGWQDSIGKAEE